MGLTSWRTVIHQGEASCQMSVTCQALEEVSEFFPVHIVRDLTVYACFYRFLNRLLKYLPLSPNLDDSTNLLLHLIRSSFVCSCTGLGNNLLCVSIASD